ncbi:hypothetical protein CEUSTIGMA_g13901.t1, partial [Chlamydomonas eustigma]
VGRTKLENQTGIHWDDRDATFLCKWFEPVSISPTNDAPDAPKLVKGKTKSSQSVGASTSTAQVVPKAVKPHGCQLNTLPITSPYGFNWEVKAKNDMVLCPVSMQWCTDAKAYVLSKRDQALAEELALELQATGEKGRLLSLGGDSRACKTTFPPSAPASDSETDELVLRKRRRTLKEGREKEDKTCYIFWRI